MVVDLSIDYVIIHCWQSAQETSASWSIHCQKSILRTPLLTRNVLRASAQSVARKRPMNPPRALPSTPNWFDSIMKRWREKKQLWKHIFSTMYYTEWRFLKLASSLQNLLKPPKVSRGNLWRDWKTGLKLGQGKTCYTKSCQKASNKPSHSASKHTKPVQQHHQEVT